MKKLTFLSLLFTIHCSLFTLFAQNINTIAGSANFGYGGDGGQATAAELQNPIGVAVDNSGNIYISDYGNNHVRMVNTSGIITTLAGIGAAGNSGDGGQATAAEINGPGGLGLDTLGNVYISELTGAEIRKVDVSSGIITTIAGNGTGGYGGDGGQATVAQIFFPTDVKFDKKGNMYIADEGNNVIRKVITSTGIIRTIAGHHAFGGGYSGDGDTATDAELNGPTGIAIDLNGNVYIGDQSNNRLRIVDTSGIINTFAGNGMTGFSGNGGAATVAELDQPQEVTIDAVGNIYIDDAVNNAIRVINSSGIINEFAGIGGALNSGFGGDGGPAIAALLSEPQGVCADNLGNIYIGDYSNSRVRKVTNSITGLVTVNNENLISVFPNPANKELTIELNGIKGNILLTLYTIQGQQMMNQPFSNQSTIPLNTSALSNGLYLLKIEKADGTNIIKKIEIQR